MSSYCTFVLFIYKCWCYDAQYILHTFHLPKLSNGGGPKNRLRDDSRKIFWLRQVICKFINQKLKIFLLVCSRCSFQSKRFQEYRLLANILFAHFKRNYRLKRTKKYYEGLCQPWKCPKTVHIKAPKNPNSLVNVWRHLVI